VVRSILNPLRVVCARHAFQMADVRRVISALRVPRSAVGQAEIEARARKWTVRLLYVS